MQTVAQTGVEVLTNADSIHSKTEFIVHAVSNNEPTLSSCFIDKHGLILTILGKQHQHTFKNYMHIPLHLICLFTTAYFICF